MPVPTTAPNPRPITVDHIDNTQHVVHGVYGLASVNGCTQTYLAFTWTAALPDTILIHVTNPGTGATTLTYLHRDLLRTGGKPRNVKVDFAGQLAFIEFTSDQTVAWFALNRQWLAEYIATTDQITEGAHS